MDLPNFQEGARVVASKRVTARRILDPFDVMRPKCGAQPRNREGREYKRRRHMASADNQW